MVDRAGRQHVEALYQFFFGDNYGRRALANGPVGP